MILFFISTVCSSFKGFKCVMQELEDLKKLEICQTHKNGNFAKPKKIAQKLLAKLQAPLPPPKPSLFKF